MHQLRSETVNQIQANLIAYFRLFAGLPGITFVEDAELTSNVGGPGAFILRAQLSSHGLEQRIDEIIDKIGQSTAAADVINWFVFPNCLPADLGERVAVRGVAGGPDGAWTLIGKIGGPGGNWMVTDLTDLPTPPVVSPRFHLERVDNAQMLGEWLTVSLTGFGHLPPAPAKWDENYYYAGYLRHGFGADAHSLHYIGYLDDQPVTAATLNLASGIAGLFDISTLEPYRRQGFGSAISWKLTEEAQKRGYTQAYVWSSQMGKRVYQGVGFVPIALGMREYEWQRRQKGEP